MECGYGDIESAYIQFESGNIIRGKMVKDYLDGLKQKGENL